MKQVIRKQVASVIKALLLSLPTSLALLAKEDSGISNEPLLSKKGLNEILKTDSSQQQFPLAANDVVVKRINFLVNRPPQLAGLKQDLKRMQQYEKLVIKKLKEHKMPLELAAIPLVETGYQNLPPQKNGTGLWMFTKDTALAYNLRVSPEKDERLDPEKATEAAIQVLKDYYERFGDWLLALAAYNQGPTRVARIIKKTGSSDVWQLMEEGHLNQYVAKVVAAAIIIEHQDKLFSES